MFLKWNFHDYSKNMDIFRENGTIYVNLNATIQKDFLKHPFLREVYPLSSFKN